MPGSDMILSGDGWSYGWADIRFTGVDIGWNLITDTGKNGVILRLADGGRFHHNEVSYTTDRVSTGNSVMTSAVTRTAIEWNEVHHNLQYGTSDGCALDADLDSPETYWRYNYTHDNSYGLITICTRNRDFGVDVHQNIDVRGRGRIINMNYSNSGVSFRNNAFWVRQPAEVEYPETHPDYVNPDRAQAGGYPQLIWETYLRDEWWGRDGQTYDYEHNAIFNEASTATFYLNPNEPGASIQTTNRTVTGNIYYGTWPADGSGALIEDGFPSARRRRRTGSSGQWAPR